VPARQQRGGVDHRRHSVTDLFENLDVFSRRSAVSSTPFFDIRGKTVEEVREKKHWGAREARKKQRRLDVADSRGQRKKLNESPLGAVRVRWRAAKKTEDKRGPAEDQHVFCAHHRAGWRII
jgi:hypothetical protein